MLTSNELKYIATKMAIATPSAAPHPTSDMENDKPKPGMMDKLKDFGNEYGSSMGIGAGAGAIAGIPVALLAHALMADKKNKNLRSYLKSALLGALVGGGLGAGGGALYKALGIGEPTMSETPLGAQNKVNQMYTDLLDDSRSYGLKRKA